LLAFSRRQTLQPEILNLNDIVRSIENMLTRLIGENIDYSSLLADDLGSILADPGQLDQVIMNIVVNARDAMPHGGELQIETANVELDAEYASLHVDAAAGPHVMLAISDTGYGMDEKTRERLFEPFFTTKGLGKGSGLGLSTVYGIIKQSGGNVWVYSEPGQGTTFKIYLPCVKGFPTRQEERAEVDNGGRDELVLVVEDESSLRNVLPRIIKALGYRVRIAAHAEEALKAIEEEDLQPDILLTDVVLPGMGGRALAEHLCQLQPKLKVLYMSGYTDNSIVHHGVLEPGIPFIQKPFSTRDLAAKLHDVLDR
jgi:CheY-like chemotaxis protein